MTSGAALSFLVVCDAAADREMVAILADRIACAEHDWLDGIIESMRGWTGAAPGETFVPWTQIGKICEARGVPRDQGLGRSSTPGSAPFWPRSGSASSPAM